ncbi:hypothetical protein VIGAN_06056100 [Vigna angularis var. angularis]|uniref:Uncharacterized protein n=1 Tax=Vigna angularis var. angularis TaxID=157739 RepID=A0A0S3S9U9_PHAAN|nr:hypothetical protein VIGAN_06056100 [Vigna angularis var. angularis]
MLPLFGRVLGLGMRSISVFGLFGSLGYFVFGGVRNAWNISRCNCKARRSRESVGGFVEKKIDVLFIASLLASKEAQ